MFKSKLLSLLTRPDRLIYTSSSIGWELVNMHSFCARYYLLRPSIRPVLTVITLYIVSTLDSLTLNNAN